jgi:transposase
MAPGPPKAIGKGLFSNGFIAMLLTERFAAGRSMNSLVTGLSRQGAEISPATLAGTCAQAGGLLGPLADAIAVRNRESWHLHADETTSYGEPLHQNGITEQKKSGEPPISPYRYAFT